MRNGYLSEGHLNADQWSFIMLHFMTIGQQ
jgi:hypothetical protein